MMLGEDPSGDTTQDDNLADTSLTQLFTDIKAALRKANSELQWRTRAAAELDNQLAQVHDELRLLQAEKAQMMQSLDQEQRPNIRSSSGGVTAALLTEAAPDIASINMLSASVHHSSLQRGAPRQGLVKSRCNYSETINQTLNADAGMGTRGSGQERPWTISQP